MATALDVFNRALRLITVKAAAQTVDSTISDDSIVALNQMMARWEADGLDLGYTAVAIPADTVTVDDSVLEPIAFNLAIVLAPEFGAPVPEYVTTKAAEGYALLLRGSLEIADNGTVEAAIRRALRLVGLPGKSYYIDAGIPVLNLMMARWARDGLGTNYVQVNSIADDFECQEEARDAVIFNLAIAMALEYGKDPPGGVMMQAREGYKAVLRDSQGWVHADLSQMPQTYNGWDITQG